MSVSLLTPDLRRILAELARRVGILERRISSAAATISAGTNGEIIFSYAGTLASSTESPPVKLRYAGFLASLAVALGTDGSTDTTLEVNRNGSVIATVVVPDTVSDYVVVVGVRVNAEDRLSLTVDTAGTGAADMTAAARFT
jgi:hypothetical protein